MIVPFWVAEQVVSAAFQTVTSDAFTEQGNRSIGFGLVYNNDPIPGATAMDMNPVECIALRHHLYTPIVSH